MRDLTRFFEMIGSFWSRFLNVLDSQYFDIAGVNVSLLDILFGFLLLSMIITVFWKGAKG